VGRERELRALRAALADALRDRGVLVLLSGEPGIGKRSLADEIALEASEAGATAVSLLLLELTGLPEGGGSAVGATRALPHVFAATASTGQSSTRATPSA
jgi:hypothetical protein